MGFSRSAEGFNWGGELNLCRANIEMPQASPSNFFKQLRNLEERFLTPKAVAFITPNSSSAR
jgi:hypothetical protein